MATSKTRPDPLLISYMTLRKAIGFLGISIPAVMIIGTFTIGGCTQVQNSISHYYYTVMGDAFVGFLISTGIFLICYKGYDVQDNIVSFLAGVFFICVALFPTSPNPDLGCVIRTLDNIPLRVNVHYISAALFYLTVAYMSLFLFTKSSGLKTKQKIVRNRIYRICGFTVLVVIILIFLEDYIPGLNNPNLHPTFWLECIANLAYGTSWLVKGEFLLKDNEQTDAAHQPANILR